MPNRAARDSELKAAYEDRFSKYHKCSGVSIPCMSVELLDKCMKFMKLGKAAGADGIETEHLIHATQDLRCYCQSCSTALWYMARCPLHLVLV